MGCIYMNMDIKDIKESDKEIIIEIGNYLVTFVKGEGFISVLPLRAEP